MMPLIYSFFLAIKYEPILFFLVSIPLFFLFVLIISVSLFILQQVYYLIAMFLYAFRFYSYPKLLIFYIYRTIELPLMYLSKLDRKYLFKFKK